MNNIKYLRKLIYKLQKGCGPNDWYFMDSEQNVWKSDGKDILDLLNSEIKENVKVYFKFRLGEESRFLTIKELQDNLKSDLNIIFSGSIDSRIIDLQKKMSHVSALPLASASPLLSASTVTSAKINMLSYNVFFKSSDYNKGQIKAFINSKKDDLDLICLQESSWDLPVNDFTIIDDIKGKGRKYTSKVFFKNTVFNLVDTFNYNYTRGIVCCRLQHITTGDFFVIINFHLEHFPKNNIIITLKIIEDLLGGINFQSSEHLIIMGDCNEFYQNFIKKYKQPVKLSNFSAPHIYFKDGGSSCCDENGINFNYISDIIGSNKKENLKNVRVFNPGPNHSDHLPLLAEYHFNSASDVAPVVPINLSKLSPNKFSLYLVPWDYNGPIKNTFRKWGGELPHITLISFQQIDYQKVKEIVEVIAKGDGKKRWVFGNKKIEKKRQDLIMFYFTSDLLKKKLTYLEEKLGIGSKKSDLHITAGTKKYMKPGEEQKIETAIKLSKDWRLVFVEEQPNRYKWGELFDLYD